MDNFKNDIEKELKKKLAHIKPSRKLFESSILSSVTKEEEYRYNKQRASELSPYQLISNNFFMKKGLLIGLPALAFVFIMVLFVSKSPNKLIPITNNYLPSIQEGKNNLNEKIVIEDNSSIDSIVASFNKDADNDLIYSENEEEDISSIMAELEDFNSLKINSYEDTI